MSDKSPFQAIEHLKSGLSLSTQVGCPLSCAYCLLHAGNDKGKAVKTIATADDLVNKLMQPETLFLNGMTPLFINNRTDPFLPEVTEQTFHILDLLIDHNICSPVVLVSKLIPPLSLRDYFAALPLMFIYSYSALEEDINYLDLKKVERLTQQLPARHLYHYMRPIIPGRNDNLSTLLKTLQVFGKAGFSGSIVSGIRITQGNRLNLGDVTETPSAHKLLEPNLYNGLLSDSVLSALQYPLFRHTSCAIDSFMMRGNRLGYYHRNGHCDPNCKNGSRCANPYRLSLSSYNQIVVRFPSIKIEYAVDQGLTIETPVSQEATAFLKNAYGVRVAVNELILSPSEEVLIGG